MGDLSRAEWSGRLITTASDPQQLAVSNVRRRAWQVWNVSGFVGGSIGYSNDPAGAYIPVPSDAGSYVANSLVIETNDLWFHGPVGSVVGFGGA